MHDTPFSLRGFSVWFICASFFLYEFFLRTVLGTFQHPLMDDLGLTLAQFSFISTTLFLLLYGLMQVPVGLIVDRLGLKKSLLLGVSICTLSTLGFAHAPGFAVAVLFRLLMGIGASFGFICLLMAVYEWMPKAHQSLFIGLSQFIGTLGPILAAGPLASLIEQNDFSWRALFNILAIVGVFLGLAVFLGVTNKERRTGHYRILSRPEKPREVCRRLFSRPQAWAITVVAASLYFAIEYLSENEGRAFLVLKGHSMSAGSYMLTLAWLGYAIGCPLLGFLSDRLQRRRDIVIGAAAIGIISLLAFLFVEDKRVLQLAFIGMGIGASGQTITFSLIAEQFKKQFVATGMGLNNAMIGVFGAVNAPVMGGLLDCFDSPLSLESYQIVFSILVLVNVLALCLMAFFIKETYNKSAVDFTYLSPSGDMKK